MSGLKRIFLRGLKGVFLFAEWFHKYTLKFRLERPETSPDEITLVTMVRDEAIRLPYFFEYYKALGVTRFFVLDHQSEDDTAARIDEEPSATRIAVKGNFYYKRAWLQGTVEKVATDSWCVLVDADEFLVWPHMEQVSLRALTKQLERGDRDAMRCQLVDMYPGNGVGETEYRSGQNPLEVAPFFDISSDTRTRAFGVSPVLRKLPLIKLRRGFKIGKGQHDLVGAKYAEFTGVLLHFKFLQDFASKVRTSGLINVLDSPYGNELKAYKRKLDGENSLSLYSESSVRYVGPEQLLSAGLMTDEGYHFDELKQSVAQ